MKFNIQVEIDDLDEYVTFDEEFKAQIQNKIVEKIQNDFSETTGKQIAQNASRLITAKTDLLINTLLEKPISVSKSWNSKEDYDSIYDMIEQKMALLYGQKFAKANASCDKDPLLANIENYVDSSLTARFTKIERQMKSEAIRIVNEKIASHELFKSLETLIGKELA